MLKLLCAVAATGLAGVLVAPAEAAKPKKPTQWAAVSAAARTDWPREWCYLKGRRGDPKLFLQQQARGCF